ncbi:prepilin-type N-terminal cleavage/methylation domain-containing protein [bacterium]|nr:prepilin-type N-terminal cleavage/methylation domain-containing protein [bacterium]
MINNIYMKNKKAFTLVEIAIVMAVLGVLAMVATPRAITLMNTKAAQKTAVETKHIQDAAKWYYVANSTWPADITALQTAGYLDSSWTANNSFGNAYSVSSTADAFTVQSNIPAAYINAAAQVLPQAVVVVETISSTVPLPGSESSHDNLLHRLAAATQEQRTLEGDVYTQGKIYDDTNNTYLLDLSPTGTSYVHRISADDVYIRQLSTWVSDMTGVPSGTIAMWSGASAPSGWDLCDGTNGTPDLRDRFIVGAGSSYAVGATGGENTHTLTIAEMPAHSHSYNETWHKGNATFNSAANYMTARVNNTGSTGGNAAHENRPPYYALCFIMKG